MRGKLNFLLVEDEANIALAIKQILHKNFQSNVDIAGNGEDALQSIALNHYDLIISDWNMPKKTGDEFLLELKQNINTKNIPFIMLTARSDKDSVISAIQGGVADYIHKPFEKKVLIEKVNKLLSIAKFTAAPIAECDLIKIIDRIVEKIRNKIDGKNVTIPALSNMYVHLRKLSSHFEIGIDDIATAVKQNEAISARLIRLSNCSYYRGLTENQSLEQSIIRVGNTFAQSYVLLFTSRDLFLIQEKRFEKSAEKIWEHSIATARCAQMLAKRAGLGKPGEIFEAGFLHDIGSVWLLGILEQFDGFKEVFSQDLLTRLNQVLHAELGAFLLGHWDLPDWMCDIAAKHAADFQSTGSRQLQLISLASHLVAKVGYGVPSSQSAYPYKECAAGLGLDLQDCLLETLLKDVCQFTRMVKNIF